MLNIFWNLAGSTFSRRPFIAFISLELRKLRMKLGPNNAAADVDAMSRPWMGPTYLVPVRVDKAGGEIEKREDDAATVAVVVGGGRRGQFSATFLRPTIDFTPKPGSR